MADPMTITQFCNFVKDVIFLVQSEQSKKNGEYFNLSAFLLPSIQKG